MPPPTTTTRACCGSGSSTSLLIPPAGRELGEVLPPAVTRPRCDMHEALADARSDDRHAIRVVALKDRAHDRRACGQHRRTDRLHAVDLRHDRRRVLEEER